MAMKPMKKPVAKMATTKPRGSKTATQVGNDNAREARNLYRGNQKGKDSNLTSKGQIAKAKSDGYSSSKNPTNKGYFDAMVKGRSNERAGGSANLSSMEKKAKANAKTVANKPKAPKAAPKRGLASRGR